ncbi:MAG TPA: prolipoprotein diacylglyceryl transferase [Cytophagales bacterium]|nr:prolipoprotein diacylglyceryl transferase [Cytophagales bacterium]
MLSSLISALIWDPDKEIFTIGFLNDHPIVWYGLLFASGFVIGQQIMFYIYRKEGLPSRDIERMTVYMVVATVIGARLGHCLFYDPEFYLSNPIEILKIWKGGLASHGGAIGILLALWLYVRSRKTKDQSLLFVLDRIVIVVALGGACIRMGNFVNNEMIGIETHSNAGVVFLTKAEDTFEGYSTVEKAEARRGEGEAIAPGRVPVTISVEFKRQMDENSVTSTLGSIENRLNSWELDSTANVYLPSNMALQYTLDQRNNVYTAELQAIGIVRHPAQLYEALYCILLFGGLLWLWARRRHKLREGVLFGIFLIVLFTLRIFDEFLKINQETWENKYVLNAGQYLSLPLIALGIFVLIYIYRKPTPYNKDRIAEGTAATSTK